MSRDFEIDNAMKVITNVRTLCVLLCMCDGPIQHSLRHEVDLVRASLCTRVLESRSWSEIVRLLLFVYGWCKGGGGY